MPVLFQDVLDLLEYLDLNVLGLRKIIRKHDKQFDLQMGTMYFGSRMGQNSQLVQLYHQVLYCTALCIHLTILHFKITVLHLECI
jgi:SPX domain protein involved in polyphosphate accumulation